METKTATDIPHIPTREEFHRHFGGEIVLSDFDTYDGGRLNGYSSHAARMVYDLRREEMIKNEKINKTKKDTSINGLYAYEREWTLFTTPLSIEGMKAVKLAYTANNWIEDEEQVG